MSRQRDAAPRHFVASAKAVFLDRDGTLIRDKKYSFRAADIEFLDGVIQGLRLLQEAGYLLIVITNQAGVARGYFREEDVVAMHKHLRKLLLREGVRIAGFYHCPHHPEGSVLAYSFKCDCRKPAPGLILRAGQEFSISLKDSWLVGDFLTDVGAGLAAGCKTILLNPQAQGQQADAAQTSAVATHTVVAEDFLRAVQIILDS